MPTDPLPTPTPPHLHPSTPPPSQGGLERQGWRGGGVSPASHPSQPLLFLCEMSAVGGANGAAESILTVAQTKTPLHFVFVFLLAGHF